MVTQSESKTDKTDLILASIEKRLKVKDSENELLFVLIVCAVLVAFIQVLYPTWINVTKPVVSVKDKVINAITTDAKRHLKTGDKIAGYVVTSEYKPCLTGTSADCRVHPVTGVTKAHKGVDIGTPTGTRVYAIANPNEEINVRCWVDSAGGGLVASFESQGISFDYLHLSKCQNGISKGGQVIALSGNSGIGTGAHLHFQQRDKNGNKVNPEWYYVKWALSGDKPGGLIRNAPK